MISILIPTYNYNVFPLVNALYQQAEALKIPFEIRVYDDCSPKPPTENEAIDKLPHARYKKLPQNIGRSAIRNLLAEEAEYENLLFLDADTQVIKKDFVKNYIDKIPHSAAIIYGGIRYQKKPPDSSEILRWVYGNQREALPVEERNKQPHLRFLTLNFLIRKAVFSRLRFNEEIPNLRHEDTLFALDAKKQKLSVLHIDNPVIHLGLESSAVFLRKSRESVESLRDFVNQGLIKAAETKLSAKADQLSKNGLSKPISLFYRTFKKPMEKNLLSQHPSLLVFDVYRLGYYLSL